MTDIFTQQKRSEIMSQVRSSGNKSTELKLIKVFDELGIAGWRRKYNVKGHPDFVFLKEKIAIFVDGCFWHGHNCRNTKPQNNHEYWDKKIQSNIIHDKEVTEMFEKRGWRVIRIWECELLNKRRPQLIKKLEPIIKIHNNQEFF